MSLKELKEVVKQASILNIISHYISVDKKGANYEAVCPFHNDSHPSLKVNPEKGIFKCFACDTAGDGISFIQFYEKIEFVDALKKAANILGIPLERYLPQKRKNPKKEMGLRIMRATQELYKRDGKLPQFSPIFENFLSDRKISQETADIFGLGYAKGRKTICHYLQTKPSQEEKAFTLSVAFELGIIKKSDRGLYDNFNHRITFPIWDFFGSVVGFGSRIIDPEQKPKYLNSKESFLFNKRYLLYGFHLAKKFIRERNRVLLVEGYMDSISLYQHGFQETVAIMGIAISPENARELARLTPNVYLALDSDSAGFKAMERVNQEFLKIGLIPKFISFSPHKDPDDFLKAEGGQSLQEKIKEAPSFLDNQLSVLKKELSHNASIEIKRNLLQEAFTILSPLGTDLGATERVARFAQEIGLKTDTELILSQYQKSLQNKKAPMPTQEEVPPPPSYLEEPVSSTPLLNSAVKNLIRHLVNYPQLFETVKIGEVLDFLNQNEVQQYIKSAYDLYFECDVDEYEELLRGLVEEDSYSTEIKALVLGELFQGMSKNLLEEKVLKKMSLELFNNLERENIQTQIKELQEKLTLAPTQKEHDLILRKISELSRKRLELNQ